MILRSATGVLTEYQFTVSGQLVEREDARLFRGPYSSSWLVAGSRRVLPGTLSLTIEIPESLDPFGSDDPASVIDAVNDAVFIDLPFYSGRVEGVTQSSVQPVARGYRVDLQVLLSAPTSYPYYLVTEGGDNLTTESGDLLIT